MQPMGASMNPKQSVHSFAEERRAAIMSMLDSSSSVQVADLAAAFGVSMVTVRNDLDALEHAGKLRRTHGGAVSLHRKLTVSVQDKRVNVNVAAKQAIAKAAVSLVKDGESLLVDSGTTALEFVRMLDMRQDVTVITADITIADFIDESLPGVNVILLGGALRKGHRYLYGPLTTAGIDVLHPDKAIVCPTALVPNRGLMTNFEQMAEVKTAFIHAARESIALVDSSKVNASGLIKFAAVDDIDTIVMDTDPNNLVSRTIADICKDSGPDLLLA